jgi:hypothetical protein
MKNILNKLIKIQQELKVGKEKTAMGGRYSYRSADDILAEVKPILKKNNCVLTISDKVTHFKDEGSNISKGLDRFGKENTSKNSASRYYIVSTATLYDVESGESISVESNAREDTEKTGMDVAQLTGSATSYARKLALGGLFCLDNEKDVDDK